MFFSHLSEGNAPEIIVEATNNGYAPDMSGVYRIVAESTEEWYNLRERMMRLEHTAIIREDADLLSEGANDFFKKVANFFKKLWAKIKEIWNKFTTWINSQVMGDKEFVKKYEKVIRNKTLTGFETKARLWKTEGMTSHVDISAALKGIQGMFSVVSPNITADDLKKLHEGINGEKHGEAVRAAIVKGGADEGDFQTKIREGFFKNGDPDAVDVEAKDIDVTKMMDIVKEASKTVSDAEKDRKNVEKLLEECAKFFDGVANKLSGLRSDTDDEEKRTYKADTFGDNGSKGYDSKSSIGGSRYEMGASAGDHKFDKEAEPGGDNNGNKGSKRNMMRESASLVATACRQAANISSTAFGVCIQGLRDRRGEFRSVLAKVITYSPKNEGYDFANESRSVLDLF